MNRTAGTGLLGSGVVLVVVVAILEFAVTVTARGFNIHTVGIILLTVGAVAFVTGLLVVTLGGRSRTTVREDVHSTPGGHERIEQRDDWVAP
jgi:hypothetical protein